MSCSSWSEGDGFCDDRELFQIGTRCKELRKEKDLLRESQSQSLELIRRLERHVKSLSEAHIEDKKQIQKLEKELLNCSQEIEFLQDQLHSSNAEVYSLGEHVHDLELKLADWNVLEDKVSLLIEELQRSESERLLLIEELQSKEKEQKKSSLHMEKLEASISSLALDSQCEVESMKLDMMALEQSCIEAKKFQQEAIQEKLRMGELIEELEAQLQNSEEIRQDLVKENKELREKLVTSGRSSSLLVHKIEEWLEDNHKSQLNTMSHSSKLETWSHTAKVMYTSDGDLEPLFSKLAIVLAPALTLKEQVDRMSLQIREYEVLVMHLKEELREQKLKAKDEAEDLTQEMAELRYQMACLLEEESKRRACIEQASLQRIAELEAQIQKEQLNACAAIKHIPEL